MGQIAALPTRRELTRLTLVIMFTAAVLGQLGDLGADLIGDLAPLAASGFGIPLGKGGGDEGGDDATPLLAGVGQRIAHKVHAAALPGGKFAPSGPDENGNCTWK